jgi:signal transduction histidine kinase
MARASVANQDFDFLAGRLVMVPGAASTFGWPGATGVRSVGALRRVRRPVAVAAQLSRRAETATLVAAPAPTPAEERESARFAAYIAHELRTPLATQRALLELALADPHADATSWQEIGADVLDACKQQERLLEACLALARSQTGLTRCERLDLGSIVADLLGARDPGALRVRSKLESAPTTGDPALIERLVDTLLGNAVRHNMPGGWVEVTTRRSGTQARVTVENTGPSVPACALTQLFEPFRQMGGEGRRVAGGLGPGLAVQGCCRRARRPRHSACSPRRRSASRGHLPARKRPLLASNWSPAGLRVRAGLDLFAKPEDRLPL